MPEVAEAGRALLDAVRISQEGSVAPIGKIGSWGGLRRCRLRATRAFRFVRRIVRKMMAAVSRYDIHAYDQDDLMTGLLRVHPKVVLDEAFAGDEKARAKAVRAFVDFQRFRKNPLEVVPDDVLLAWCDVDPAIRYPDHGGIGRLV